MEFDDRQWQPANRPSRRSRGRIMLASCVAVAVAAVAAAGLALANNHSTSVGSGVVLIETNLAYQGERAAGTGIVLTSSGEILTNNHVIRGATEIRVVVPGAGRAFNAKVVGYDAGHDVAVLQTSSASDLKTLSLGDSDSVDTGDAVHAVGNAGGTGRLITASGSVTGTNKAITVNDDQGGSESLSGLIETNAGIKPGDSGGPLLNSSNQAIGMDTAASVSSDGQTTTDGYAIPIDSALAIVQQIEGGGSASVHAGQTAFLGVEVTASSYGDGASIASVVPGGPAANAGLTQGDTITAVDGQTISSPDRLGLIIAAEKPGASISVSYVDQYGQSQTTQLTLTSGPPR